MRRVTYSKAASKTLRRLPAKTVELIVGKIELYARDPQCLAANVKALRGFPGMMRLRVGDWRVVFTEDLEVVAVSAIAARGDIYRRGPLQ
jgi:mRNA interferase RelE/StbE